MSKKPHVDPLDTLGAAYETMYEHVAENLHRAKDKTGPLIHQLVDDAKEKAKEIEEVTEEDAEKLTAWLKRDLDEVTSYLSETGYAVKDWLGFETSLIKNVMIRMMLEAADKTTVELLRMKENAHKPYDYHTGEIAGFGTLICDECGEKLHFHKAGKIPPCPRCHKTSFHRIQID
jgi:rubrerythrin